MIATRPRSSLVGRYPTSRAPDLPRSSVPTSSTSSRKFSAFALVLSLRAASESEGWPTRSTASMSIIKNAQTLRDWSSTFEVRGCVMHTRPSSPFQSPSQSPPAVLIHIRIR
ncbi:hypothetical protein OH77DRAFT_1257606 [Trametes cingulata]|nr:hypothetical protein OH77DRAFT_1257606 [Trametes cingulata]